MIDICSAMPEEGDSAIQTQAIIADMKKLRNAKVSPKKARTIDIADDHRRRNRCVESRQLNVNRLKVYLSKLLIFLRGSKAKSGDNDRSELENVAQNVEGGSVRGRTQGLV